MEGSAVIWGVFILLPISKVGEVIREKNEIKELALIIGNHQIYKFITFHNDFCVEIFITVFMEVQQAQFQS